MQFKKLQFKTQRFNTLVSVFIWILDRALKSELLIIVDNYSVCAVRIQVVSLAIRLAINSSLMCYWC